jgi:hypothetical protein
MAELKTYRVRDPQGNIYGPADMSTLRQWVGQGRIVAGMSIAEEGTPDWEDAATHAGLADLFGQVGGGAGAAGGANPYAASTSQTVEVTRVGHYATGGPQLNTLGLIALISGILGIVGCCCYGLPGIILGPAAIIMGSLALKQFRTEPERYSGKGLATAGLICGIAGLLLGLAVAAVFVLALVNRHP